MQRIADFSKGFFAMRQKGPRVLLTDLRMGQEPRYVFTVVVAERHSAAVPLARPEQISQRPDIECSLRWLLKRIWGQLLPPPVRFGAAL